MRASIESRLEALEAELIEPKRMTIWIHSVSPGAIDRPVQRIRHNDQEWHRRDGETEDTFKNRAELEAVLQPEHSALLMTMD